MSFEKRVIKSLAGQLPHLHDRLMKIHDNIQDLMLPFKIKACYLPQMKGSYYIKAVLPALVPEMQEAYKKLESVQNGSDAMQVFARLCEIEDEKERIKLRNALLEYCKLDTLAMVEVLRKLRKSVCE